MLELALSVVGLILAGLVLVGAAATARSGAGAAPWLLACGLACVALADILGRTA